MDKYSQAASLLRQFEGFRDSPYFDVTKYRAGYGSDTTTLADGRVVPIQQGMKVNKEDSERDLMRRVKNDFAAPLERKFGESFTKLPENAQAALISLAYQQGSISDRNLPSLSKAIRSGDVNKIAEEVRSIGKLKNRRNTEADYLLGKLRIKGEGSDAPSAPTTPAMLPLAGAGASTFLNTKNLDTGTDPLKLYSTMYGDGYTDINVMNKLFGM